SERFTAITDTKTSDKKLVFAPGGSNRTQSVYNGVSHATKRTRLIAIHDCARPFVTCEMIQTLIEKASEAGASTACTKVVDTIKYHDEENGITYTPERSKLLAIQTPQCFDIDIYRVSLATALKDGNVFTDETSMVEKAGYKVEYVETGRKNIKLTTKEDIIIARALYAAEERDRKKTEE
ncbi:MAG: 2-C-methyl-D-erythritol 4-phosphate cytidylyltransferase, partial [Clostridia bacterium]|nr:2-C-methyl-D-erythritol 4-phosphate cytidylyltransferase [Clostridia bacterium]